MTKGDTNHRHGGYGPLLGVLTLVVGLSGCATKGIQLQRELIEQGAPHPEAIVQDFARNDRAITSFQIEGVQFLLTSPELTDATVRGRALIAFEPPDRLFISAREPRSGTQVLRLATAQGEALVYVFTRNERRIDFWRRGEPIEGLPINVAPTDIVKEIFLPEDWDSIPKRYLRLVDFNAENETVTIAIGPEDKPWRRIEAHPVTGGFWVISRSIHLDDGAVVADTRLSDYRDYGGIRFPNRLEASFPQTGASIAMTLSRSPQFNQELRHEWFDFTQYADTAD